MPAFLHAQALGVDVLEMDVVLSADGQVVVSHEPWLAAAICLGPAGQRLAPATERQFNLYQMPYAAIRACDCGQLQHPAFREQEARAGAYKPLLGEVLAATEAAARLRPIGYSIELKSSPEGDGIYHPAPAVFVAAVLAQLRPLVAIWPRTTLLSFDARVLRAVRAQAPELATCLLSEDGRPWLASIAALGFVPTTFGPNYQTVQALAVQQLRANHPNLRLVPWTVNEPADVLRLAALGVDGLTTDYPNRALALFGRTAETAL
jgi:glycerophosphoryl diester phosphodiesterase